VHHPQILRLLRTLPPQPTQPLFPHSAYTAREQVANMARAECHELPPPDSVAEREYPADICECPKIHAEAAAIPPCPHLCEGDVFDVVLHVHALD